MFVAVPEVQESNGTSKAKPWYTTHHAVPNTPKAAGPSTMMTAFLKNPYSPESAGLMGLRQKPPVYNRETKQYRQNFRGRATLPSFYNVQLTRHNNSKRLCSFLTLAHR